MAWPEHSEVKSLADAMRRAVALDFTFHLWSDEKTKYVYQRLRKSYSAVGPSLEEKSRAKGKYAPPESPTILGEQLDPDFRFEIEGRNVHQTIDRLEMASEWLSVLAALMRSQWANRNINPDLRQHSASVIEKIEAQMADDGVPPLRDMTLRVMPPKPPK